MTAKKTVSYTRGRVTIGGNEHAPDATVSFEVPVPRFIRGILTLINDLHAFEIERKQAEDRAYRVAYAQDEHARFIGDLASGEYRPLFPELWSDILPKANNVIDITDRIARNSTAPSDLRVYDQDTDPAVEELDTARKRAVVHDIIQRSAASI